MVYTTRRIRKFYIPIRGKRYSSCFFIAAKKYNSPTRAIFEDKEVKTENPPLIFVRDTP